MAKCTAKKRQGEQCRRDAIKGGNVCRIHGGAAPQVKRRAEERLAALVDPAIAKLGKIVRSKGLTMVHLAAAKDILDRAANNDAATQIRQRTTRSALHSMPCR